MIKNLKSKLVTSIKSKRINVFFLFLAASFGILILTKLSKTYTNTISFQINKINVPDEHVIFNDKESVLNISIKAHGFGLLKYYFNKPKIDIDFKSKIVKTDSFYIWNNSTAYSDVIAQFGGNAEIVNINPDTLRFRYDINAVKYVPIKLNLDIKYAIGYDVLDSFTAIPDSIKIIGPKALVEKIESIDTDTLRLENINKNISELITLKLPKNQDELKFSVTQVTLQANVGKFTEGNLKIPVHVKNVPDNIHIKYYPKNINVYYYTSLLNYNSISIKDFKIECDFLEVTDKQPFLIPRIIRKPKTVRNVKINQEQIEFIITE